MNKRPEHQTAYSRNPPRRGSEEGFAPRLKRPASWKDLIWRIKVDAGRRGNVMLLQKPVDLQFDLPNGKFEQPRFLATALGPAVEGKFIGVEAIVVGRRDLKLDAAVPKDSHGGVRHERSSMRVTDRWHMTFLLLLRAATAFAYPDGYGPEFIFPRII